MKYIIGLGTCNGEEEQFSAWMQNREPKLDIEIKNTNLTGLFDENNNSVDEGEYFGYYPWDKYCNR